MERLDDDLRNKTFWSLCTYDGPMDHSFNLIYLAQKKKKKAFAPMPLQQVLRSVLRVIGALG